MKYILLVPDGMADEPVESMDNKTPLEVSRKPYMDDLANRGTVGVVNVTPEGMYPGSDAANMAEMTHVPALFWTLLWIGGSLFILWRALRSYGNPYAREVMVAAPRSKRRAYANS